MTAASQCKCKIDWCERKVGTRGAKGLCSAHYKRLLLGADMDKPFRVNGTGWLSSNGYTYIGRRAIHRRALEAHIGRRLTYNEVIHHKDGNKLNNSLDNLEVMDRGDHIRLHVNGKPNAVRAREKEIYGFCLADRDTARKARAR